MKNPLIKILNNKEKLKKAVSDFHNKNKVSKSNTFYKNNALSELDDVVDDFLSLYNPINDFSVKGTKVFVNDVKKHFDAVEYKNLISKVRLTDLVEDKNIPPHLKMVFLNNSTYYKLLDKNNHNKNTSLLDAKKIYKLENMIDVIEDSDIYYDKNNPKKLNKLKEKFETLGYNFSAGDLSLLNDLTDYDSNIKESEVVPKTKYTNKKKQHKSNVFKKSKDNPNNSLTKICNKELNNSAKYYKGNRKNNSVLKSNRNVKLMLGFYGAILGVVITAGMMKDCSKTNIIKSVLGMNQKNKYISEQVLLEDKKLDVNSHGHITIGAEGVFSRQDFREFMNGDYKAYLN